MVERHRAELENGRASNQGVVVCSPEAERDGAIDEIIVTIDGPAGTGKSSVGRALASQLGVEFLDTGAMYRAATALAIDRGLNLKDGSAVAPLAAEADLHFDWRADPPTLLAFMKPYATRLRDPDVSAAVSGLASLPEVRQVLVRKQRIIGAQHPRLVTEGRDQGSVVFPDADVKFYLDASARVRAERRAAQLEETGAKAELDVIEQEIIARDLADSTRKVGPLVCPDDAHVIDTTNLSFDEVVEALERRVRETMRARRATGQSEDQ